jgi:arylsulfatase A-like enzyme
MADKTPNILIIVADQLRYDCVGKAGRFKISTPNIDRLSEQGVFFTKAYTPSPVCAPARQALLSGRSAESIGALWNYDFIYTKTLSGDDCFYTDTLKQQGYKNAFIGKWHSSNTHGAVDFGFDVIKSFAEHDKMVREKYPCTNYSSGWFGEKNPIPLEDSRTHWLAQQSINVIGDFINNNHPFHMRVDFTDPHLPCRPSKPFSEMYPPNEIEPWDSFGDTLENKPYIQRQQIFNWGLENTKWDEWSKCVSLYYGMISQLDDAVGKILDALDKAGGLENTIVIFTSDHGDLCGGHGMLDKHYVLYEDVVHVPLIIRYPALFKAGEKVDSFVSNCLDIAPTLEEICKIPPAGKRHGFSLVPLCKHIDGTDSQTAGSPTAGRNFEVSAASGQQFGLYTQRCIVTNRWKYIWNATDMDELYDLENDVGEKNNLISRLDGCPDKQVLQELKKQLYEELLRRDDPFITSGWLKRQFFE